MLKLLFSVALGSAAQEIIHWYGLRFRINEEKYQALMKSSAYWMVVAAMIVFSMCVGYVFLENSVDAKAAFLFGLTLPAFIKQLATIQQSKTHLGELDETVKSYLGIR